MGGDGVMAKLGEICAFQSGGTPSKNKPEYFGGEIPWISTTALNGDKINEADAVTWITPKAIRESAAKIVPANSIMIGTRVGIGKVAINTVEMSTSQDVISLINIDEDKWYKPYLCKLLLSKKDYFNSQARGATIKGIKIDVVANIDVPEIDYATQRKVASTLNKIDTLIVLRKHQLEKLDELIKARFVEMFGTFPANPFRWSIGKIQDVVSDVRYGSSRPAVEGGKYPYLRMNNITYSGELDLRDTKRIDIPDSELDKCTVRRGDVLFNRTNSKELVGKTCVYNRDELMVLAGFVIRVRINERIRPEVLSAFLNMDFSKRMLIGMCKTAIGQANINAKELQNIDLYIPPIELQDQFVTLKNKIDQQKQTVQQSLEKLELLKKALMQEYFG